MVLEEAEMSETHTAGRLSNLEVRLLRVHWLMRAPIVLYRVRLGFLLGNRFMLLEHHGRISGKVRRTVVEVIGSPAPGSYLAVSGLGTRAQWFRNVRAAPRVRIATGVHGLRSAQARVLDQDEAAAALDAYAKAHPRAWASFAPILETTLSAPARTVPVIRFDVLAEGGKQP